MQKPIGWNGNFVEVSEYAKEKKWRLTSKLCGEIAHKHYLQYLASLPKGPIAQEILQQKQREMDNELWLKIS